MPARRHTPSIPAPTPARSRPCSSRDPADRSGSHRPMSPSVEPAIARYPWPVILLIDNYDSFTWNLVQRLGELDPTLEVGKDLLVIRNDRITADQAAQLNSGQGPTKIIISPGPCTPKESGVSPDIIRRFAGKIPILGVCLG